MSTKVLTALGRSLAVSQKTRMTLRAPSGLAIDSSGAGAALGTGSEEGGGSIPPIVEAARASGEAAARGAEARRLAGTVDILLGARVFFGQKSFGSFERRRGRETETETSPPLTVSVN